MFLNHWLEQVKKRQEAKRKEKIMASWQYIRTSRPKRAKP